MPCKSTAMALDVEHPQPDPLDCARRRQAHRADLGAIHDRATAEQPVGIAVEVLQPFPGRTVTAVADEAIRLQQAGRPDERVGIPPRRGALAGAASTHDALIRAVEPFALSGGLQALLFRR